VSPLLLAERPRIEQLRRRCRGATSERPRQQQQGNPRASPHCPAPPVAASGIAERRGSIGAARVHGGPANCALAVAGPPGAPSGPNEGRMRCPTPQKSPNPSTSSKLRGAVARGCSHGIRDNSGVSGRRGGGGFWNGHFHRLRDRAVRRVGDVAAPRAAFAPTACPGNPVNQWAICACPVAC
jgi:hypothetical protein